MARKPTAAIVKRALSYPYEAPAEPYLYRDGAAEPLPADGPDLTGRTPLVAYGANAAPAGLARKLAALPGRELPVLRTELEGWDVVYSAHISPYGAVPATLVRSEGTAAGVWVIHPDPEQLPAIAVTEPNYDLVEVAPGLRAYVSRWGPLELDGAPVPLRRMGEPEVLERIRRALAPELSLEQFILSQVEAGGGPLSA